MAALFLLAIIADVRAYPDYFAPIYFDWDRTTGFRSISVAPPGIKLGLIERIYGGLVAFESRPWVAREFGKKWGWKEAKGKCYVMLLPFPPVVYHLGYLVEPWEIIDPEVTPLMHAAERDSVSSVQRLLASGADINARDQRGWTALMHASMDTLGGTDTVQALIAAGADVNAKDRTGRTALTWAARSDRRGTESLLLAAGADPNTKNNDGETPLVETLGNPETAAKLLAAGADPNARDSKGATALSIAKAAGDTKLVQLLTSAGAHE